MITCYLSIFLYAILFKAPMAKLNPCYYYPAQFKLFCLSEYGSLPLPIFQDSLVLNHLKYCQKSCLMFLTFKLFLCTLLYLPLLLLNLIMLQ